jgi:hypothetical protein
MITKRTSIRNAVLRDKIWTRNLSNMKAECQLFDRNVRFFDRSIVMFLAGLTLTSWAMIDEFGGSVEWLMAEETEVALIQKEVPAPVTFCRPQISHRLSVLCHQKPASNILNYRMAWWKRKTVVCNLIVPLAVTRTLLWFLMSVPSSFYRVAKASLWIIDCWINNMTYSFTSIIRTSMFVYM